MENKGRNVRREDEKRKVLELRAMGLSFEDITHKLNIDIQTLLAWTSESQEKVKKGGCNC